MKLHKSVFDTEVTGDPARLTTNWGGPAPLVDHVSTVHAGAPTVPGEGLAVADLLADLAEVTLRLSDRLAADDVLDAYLLAAGAVQIVEDHLQRDVLALRRAAVYLRDRGLPAWVTFLLAALATSCERLRGLRPSELRAARWRDECAQLRDMLARRLVAVPDAEMPPGDENARARRLGDQVTALHPRISSAVLRIPSCFRSFDQQPEDMVILAARYARRHPGHDRPVLVLGVRTSGSYLAPLVAAALWTEGFTDVRAETARPEHRLRTAVHRISRHVTRQGGRVAIVDDPPTTGHAVQQVARQVVRSGVAREALTLLLPLFDVVPVALRGYDTVVLPEGEWSIHRRLEPAAVGAALASLWGRPVGSVHRLPGTPDVPGRGHHRALFDVVSSEGEHRTVVAAGAGVGYLGRHALAVARALPGYLPRTHGFADGVIFRDWLPSDQRLRTVRPGDAPQLAGYVRARAAALPAVGDHSARLAGRQPVWEAGSRVLQEGYGRLGVLLRPLLLDPLLRGLCSVARPSVIDGATGAACWFREQGALRKVNADVRAFANTDLACYDPVYDLAGIDPGGRDPAVVAALRDAIVCDDERFLIYQLVHLWDRQRTGAAAHRESARAVQRYISARFLADLNPAPAGPLCTVDLDGVLESDALGFPIMTPSAALALRSMIAHGCRPVLATGRSLDEVRERCESYGLVGGVAEYGAVAYHHTTGTVRELVPTADLHTLGEVREVLRRTPGVSVDEDYHRIVRAYRSGTGTERRPLPPALVRTILAGIDATHRVRVIQGHGQTDLVAAEVDKGDGLRSLAALLGTTADPHGIALAVGDSAADLPMLALARHAYAPANADAEVRAAGVHLLGRGFAAGLAQAVQRLIGHRPGTCPTCRPPVPPARGEAMLTLLDAQHGGARGLPVAVARGLLRRQRLRWIT